MEQIHEGPGPRDHQGGAKRSAKVNAKPLIAIGGCVLVAREWLHANHEAVVPEVVILTAIRKKARLTFIRRALLRMTPGSDLLSHTPAHAVPSAVAGLTSVFGMGTGVTLPL